MSDNPYYVNYLAYYLISLPKSIIYVILNKFYQSAYDTLPLKTYAKWAELFLKFQTPKRAGRALHRLQILTENSNTLTKTLIYDNIVPGNQKYFIGGLRMATITDGGAIIWHDVSKEEKDSFKFTLIPNPPWFQRAGRFSRESKVDDGGGVVIRSGGKGTCTKDQVLQALAKERRKSKWELESIPTG